MTNPLYFPPAPRGNGLRQKGRNGNLPTFSSAIHEKLQQQAHPLPWTITLSIPILGVRNRRLRLLIPNFRRLHQFSVTRFGRKRGSLVLCLGFFLLLFAIFALTKRFATRTKQWPTLSTEPSTLVFRREDLQRIWKWEIASGHYPSRQEIPEKIGLTSAPFNPAVPPSSTIPSRFRPPPGPFKTTTTGTGPKRVYLDFKSHPPNIAYPPRPVPRSIADLDIIMKHCDFSQHKYVRDCLEVLRVGGGLDHGNRYRRANMDEFHYIYQVVDAAENQTEATPVRAAAQERVRGVGSRNEYDSDPEAGLAKKRGVQFETDVFLPAPVHHEVSAESPCDKESPRLFHMFWTGPFTDKPYLALLSFLYTQNLGLHLHEYPSNSSVCRPQFWLWINPGPAAAVPNQSATRDMFDQLKSSPWASPFLHPRFKDVIQFKLWNTTEQLDGVPELRDEWRAFKEVLFNSGGHIINVPAEKQREQETVEPESTLSGGNETAQVIAAPTGSKKSKADEDDLLNRTGSKSSSSYDRLSVILSDLARFILCHRFGGIYMDVDNIFLRDWEELWGWNGAFAYRWSRLEKYNTAVLRLNKGSALGTFLFRTALKNGLDFHPMTVSRYTKDAYLEGLLLRLPDALFDSAWLNTESYQRERPPQPYFLEFGDFFDTPAQNSAAPQALGFNGFFKGAYSYHFHNFWWKPFDPARNWPDLGPRFSAGERTVRMALAKDDESVLEREERLTDDKRDLDWATVLKRTFEAYIRGERPNMYGEWMEW